MASTADFRNGMVLQIDGQLFQIVYFQHVKPGKGGAFAQVEMRNLRNGSKLNERFRSADKVERVRLEQKDQQFLYEHDGMLVFMDSETYEQIELPAEGRPVPIRFNSSSDEGSAALTEAIADDKKFS